MKIRFNVRILLIVCASVFVQKTALSMNPALFPHRIEVAPEDLHRIPADLVRRPDVAAQVVDPILAPIVPPVAAPVVNHIQGQNLPVQPPVQPDEVHENWATKPFRVAKEKSEWFKLFGAFMHAPYIFTADSTDAQTIKASASLAAASTSLKMMSMISGEGTMAQHIIWDMPKMFGYLLSAGYDAIRILDAPKVAFRNTIDAKKLKFFKFSQTMQLLIEVVLRITAIRSKPHDAWLSSELADVVSIWRLLERYKTYFISEIDDLEIGFVLKKNLRNSLSGKEEPSDEKEIEQLEELAALAEELAAQQAQLANASHVSPVQHEVHLAS